MLQSHYFYLRLSFSSMMQYQVLIVFIISLLTFLLTTIILKHVSYFYQNLITIKYILINPNLSIIIILFFNLSLIFILHFHISFYKFILFYHSTLIQFILPLQLYFHIFPKMLIIIVLLIFLIHQFLHLYFFFQFAFISPIILKSILLIHQLQLFLSSYSG